MHSFLRPTCNHNNNFRKFRCSVTLTLTLDRVKVITTYTIRAGLPAYQPSNCSLTHYRNLAIWISWNIDILRSLNSRDSFIRRKFENRAQTNCRPGWSVRCWRGYPAWNKVQMLCIWSSWCHCYAVISCFIEIQTGLTFLLPAHSGCPGKEVLKRVSCVVCHCSIIAILFGPYFCNTQERNFSQHIHTITRILPRLPWLTSNI